MFLIKVVYAMLCVCVFLCPSSFIVGSPSYLLSILIQNGIQANSHHQIYFDVASIVRPFFFYKTFFKTPDHKWLIFCSKITIKIGIFLSAIGHFQIYGGILHRKLWFKMFNFDPYNIFLSKCVNFCLKLAIWKSKFRFSIKNVHWFIKCHFRLFSSQMAIFHLK